MMRRKTLRCLHRISRISFYLRSASDISDFASEGIFEPLSQYINEETMPNFYKFWQQYPEMQRYMVDGEMYVFNL